LNAGGGLVIGWLTFTNDVDTLNDLEGMVNWIKPAQASATRTYPNGFAFGVANGIEAQGALWINTQPLLNSRNGVVAFTGGGLNQPTFDSISVDANGKITDLTRTNALVLTLTASSGLFAGSFTATDGTMRHINFSGAIHQKQGKGYGQFLGADQSGNVSIRFTP
jgi:hypothetical protein